MFNFRGNKDLCKLDKEYLHDLLCKYGSFCLQHSKTFDISHVFLWVTVVELSTLKQVRFFGSPCIISFTEIFTCTVSHLAPAVGRRDCISVYQLASLDGCYSIDGYDSTEVE